MSILSTGTAPVVRASLSELVYSRLLEGIVSGVLESGAHLHVADIARELQVSPSPVREALLRLATEGLAANQTNRRATVVRFEPRDVAEIFQVREILESGAARLAAPRMTRKKLASLRAAIEHCAALGHDAGRKKDMLDLDNRFHIEVAEAAGNGALAGEITRCNRRVRVMQWLHLAPATMQTAFPEHEAILHALEQKDAEGAAAAMAHHVRAALAHLQHGLGPRFASGAE